MVFSSDKTFKLLKNDNIYNFVETPEDISDHKRSSKETQMNLNLEDSTSSDQMSMTFTGCGLLGLYYIGVIACLRRYLPKCEDLIVCGASSGALAALTLCLNLPLELTTAKLVQVAILARNKSLGMMHPGINLSEILYDFLDKALPEDCHKKVEGRLFLSATRVFDGRNVFLSQFDSKEDLIRAMQCSCFIPFISDIVPPKYKGVSYMDGAFSNNFPKVSKSTITISPYGGQSDISPKDYPIVPCNFTFYDNVIPLSATNLFRLLRVVFPEHPKHFTKLCEQGFSDALGFLLTKNMISCTLCLSTQLSFDLNENRDFKLHDCNNIGDKVSQHSSIRSSECMDCRESRTAAEKDSLPQNIIKTVQFICEPVDSDVNNRAMKLLSALRTLLLIPIDFTLVMLWKLWKEMHIIRSEHKASFHSLAIFFRSLLSLGNLKYR